MPGTADLARVIAQQPHAAANLVFLGDKSVQWNSARTAFVMYAVQGRSVIVFGDPVGPPAAAPELVAQFVAMCDRIGLMPVFYEVSQEHLATFAEHGLQFVKVGEQARVPLASFSLAGSTFKTLRNAVTHLAREGVFFRVVEPPDVHALVRQLQRVSDEWLERKAAAEKGFSVGCFKPEYVEGRPVAVAARGSHIVAFANLWLTQTELALDMMRQRSDAPSGTMDALFAQLMLWGRDHGYQWCNLGMAPLAGLPESNGPWARLGGFIYRHGEAFYNFRGLRAYKEKFHPVWEPKYMVYPGHRSLARALADVTALVAGGYRGIFTRTRSRVA